MGFSFLPSLCFFFSKVSWPIISTHIIRNQSWWGCSYSHKTGLLQKRLVVRASLSNGIFPLDWWSYSLLCWLSGSEATQPTNFLGDFLFHHNQKSYKRGVGFFFYPAFCWVLFFACSSIPATQAILPLSSHCHIFSLFIAAKISRSVRPARLSSGTAAYQHAHVEQLFICWKEFHLNPPIGDETRVEGGLHLLHPLLLGLHLARPPHIVWRALWPQLGAG